VKETKKTTNSSPLVPLDRDNLKDIKERMKEQPFYDKTDAKLLDFDVTQIDIFSLARHGRFLQLKKILDMGVDPNSKDKSGNTILIIAA